MAEKKEFKSSPPPVLVHGVSQADMKVSPYAIACPSPRHCEKLCSVCSSNCSHKGNWVATCRLTNADVPKAAAAFASRMTYFKQYPVAGMQCIPALQFLEEKPQTT